jgi:hypothetical protein
VHVKGILCILNINRSPQRCSDYIVLSFLTTYVRLHILHGINHSNLNLDAVLPTIIRHFLFTSLSLTSSPLPHILSHSFISPSLSLIIPSLHSPPPPFSLYSYPKTTSPLPEGGAVHMAVIMLLSELLVCVKELYMNEKRRILFLLLQRIDLPALTRK